METGVCPAGEEPRDRARCAEGSGELVHLEIHASPALSGSLREVVVELRYDGAAEPAVRLPLPELVGLPHPWIVHRWHTYNGTLAAGLKYPWYVNTPRFHFPEDTFHFNLPVPFAKGLRLDLVNRSDKMRFTGLVRALAMPLSEQDAQNCGRLCATRAICPVTAGADPQPLLRVPGAGHLVGLGLFTTGGDPYPPAVHNCVLSLVRDGGPPILGQGVVPLWFMGAYGGSIGNQPIWNHPLYDDKYGGVMRYFLTDPLPFSTESVFSFTPGTDGKGAPTEATALAFWYRFGAAPFTAPPLPEHAEPLPHSTFGTYAAQKDSRPFWDVEAEDLVPAACVHGGEVRAEEDGDHNYHPSAGKYLHYVADQAGDYLDCAVPFPRTRYFAVGTGALWGPNRGTFEMDVPVPAAGALAPGVPSGRCVLPRPRAGPRADEGAGVRRPGLAFVAGHRHRVPAALPEPRAGPGGSGAVHLPGQTPGQHRVLAEARQAADRPAAAHRSRLARVRGSRGRRGKRRPDRLAAQAGTLGVVRLGRGGPRLTSRRPGAFRALVPAGQSQVSEVILKGSLGPQQGDWQVRVLQDEVPVSAAIRLAPGKDEKEVVEWRVPATGMRLPGPVVLDFTCSEAGQKTEPSRPPRKAELVLDAWATK